MDREGAEEDDEELVQHSALSSSHDFLKRSVYMVVVIFIQFNRERWRMS
jgi:hypothetical protein